MSLFCWNLSLILVSLLNMSALKCLILSVEICKILWKVEEWRKHDMYFTKSAIYVFTSNSFL